VLETVSATEAAMAAKKAMATNVKKAVIIWRLRGVVRCRWPHSRQPASSPRAESDEMREIRDEMPPGPRIRFNPGPESPAPPAT
jgi:hypothetical protein